MGLTMANLSGLLMDSFSVLVVAAAQVSNTEGQEEYRIGKKKKKKTLGKVYEEVSACTLCACTLKNSVLGVFGKVCLLCFSYLSDSLKIV